MSLIYLTTGRSKDQRALEVFTASWTEDPEWVDGQTLRFEAKPEDRIRLNLTLEAFEADLGSRLAVVAGFADDQLMRTAVLMALHYGSGQVTELADLLILDYLPATPLTAENLAWHVVFGLGARHVEAVMVDGIWRIWARRPLSLNPMVVADQAREAARAEGKIGTTGRGIAK